tara:strand:- start:20456 stop:21178 length:723 start_codon:yes stop_codon:yes gene_type:complete
MANLGDVVVNEIYNWMGGDVDFSLTEFYYGLEILPDLQETQNRYVELYNRSNYNIQLGGWVLNASTFPNPLILDDYIIKKGGYKIIFLPYDNCDGHIGCDYSWGSDPSDWISLNDSDDVEINFVNYEFSSQDNGVDTVWKRIVDGMGGNDVYGGDWIYKDTPETFWITPGFNNFNGYDDGNTCVESCGTYTPITSGATCYCNSLCKNNYNCCHDYLDCPPESENHNRIIINYPNDYSLEN